MEIAAYLVYASDIGVIQIFVIQKQIFIAENRIQFHIMVKITQEFWFIYSKWRYGDSCIFLCLMKSGLYVGRKMAVSLVPGPRIIPENR